MMNSIRYSIPDAEDLCECPYDDTHMVRAKRMPYHLVKCRQHYKGLNFVNCPFNARHEMPAPELRHHIMNCPDRVMVQQDITAAARNRHRGNLALPISQWEPTDTQEDWEIDAPRYPTFGIDKAVWMQKKIMAKSTIGMTRAEKKKYYEILRVNYHREQEGLEPLEMDLQEDDQDSQLQELLQKQIMSLRKPLSKPQVLLAVEQRGNKHPLEPTPIFNQSLLLAGIGRGKAVVRPEMRLPRPGSNLASSLYGSSTTCDATSETASETATSNLVASSVDSALRGIGRGMPGIGRGILPPGFLLPSGTESEVSNTTYRDSDTGITGTEAEDVTEVEHNDEDDVAPVDEQSPADELLKETKCGKEEKEEEQNGEEESPIKEDGSFLTEDEIQKLIKKFQKKLRGIEVLEDRAKEGIKLNEEEMDKISKKEEIMTQIRELKSQ